SGRRKGRGWSSGFASMVAGAAPAMDENGGRPCLPPPETRHIRLMLNRQNPKQVPDPAFFAPFVSAPMRVEPGWIDYNGHLNMAYYNVLFDRAVDEVYELLGCGLAYLQESRHSCFTAEVHLRYLRELNAGDLVRVTF